MCPRSQPGRAESSGSKSIQDMSNELRPFRWGKDIRRTTCLDTMKDPRGHFDQYRDLWNLNIHPWLFPYNLEWLPKDTNPWTDLILSSVRRKNYSRQMSSMSNFPSYSRQMSSSSNFLSDPRQMSSMGNLVIWHPHHKFKCSVFQKSKQFFKFDKTAKCKQLCQLQSSCQHSQIRGSSLSEHSASVRKQSEHPKHAVRCQSRLCFSRKGIRPQTSQTHLLITGWVIHCTM